MNFFIFSLLYFFLHYFFRFYCVHMKVFTRTRTTRSFDVINTRFQMGGGGGNRFFIAKFSKESSNALYNRYRY